MNAAFDPLELRALVERFLLFVFEGNESQQAAESRLERLLDELACAHHDVSFDHDDSAYPDPPDQDFQKLYAIVAHRFPAIGLYNVALSMLEVGEAVMGVGDAVDDLTDIVKDLMEVAWRFENTSTADALWHFDFLYRIHWGEHLRDLQRFLHESRRDS